jgi:hypothetical protein
MADSDVTSTTDDNKLSGFTGLLGDQAFLLKNWLGKFMDTAGAREYPDIGLVCYRESMCYRLILRPFLNAAL